MAKGTDMAKIRVIILLSTYSQMLSTQPWAVNNNNIIECTSTESMQQTGLLSASTFFNLALHMFVFNLNQQQTQLHSFAVKYKSWLFTPAHACNACTQKVYNTFCIQCIHHNVRLHVNYFTTGCFRSECVLKQYCWKGILWTGVDTWSFVFSTHACVYATDVKKNVLYSRKSWRDLCLANWL